MMLDQDADESLERAENGAVQHERMMLLAIGTDVGGIEPLWHLRVELQSAALPGAADRVLQMEFELGTIESAFARQRLIFEPGLLERSLEVGLGAIPFLVAADALVGPGRKLHLVIGKAEIAVHGIEQGAEGLGLLDQLVMRAEDVPVILRELTDSHNSMKCAVRFVPVAAAVLGKSQRQLPVAGSALLEDLDVCRTIQRL